MTDKVNPPIPRDASSRGGKAKTLAKRQALADVQTKKRDSIERARQALTVPAGFRSVPDFLAIVADLSGRRLGGRREIAGVMGIDPAGLAKMLKPHAKRWPNQPQLDKLAKWHAALLGDEAKVAPVMRAGDAPVKIPVLGTIAKAKTQAAKLKLSDEINERLVLTARRRHVDPKIYLEQILDRHLPKLYDLK